MLKKKAFFAGPLANASTPLLGTHYKGAACPMPDGKELDSSCVPSIYQALQARVAAGSAAATTRYSGGCSPLDCATGKGGGETLGFKCFLTGCPPRTIDEAVAVAKDSTHVVIVVGITGLESEGTAGDRTSIDLPAVRRKQKHF